MDEVTTLLRAYADQLDAGQHPVSAEEALSRVDAVRVVGENTHWDDHRWRWRNLAIAGAVAVGFVLVLAAPYVFGQWVESTDSQPPTGTDRSPTTVVDDTTMDEAIVRQTTLGRWTWTRLPLEPNAQVVAWDGNLWAIESDPLYPLDPNEARSPTSRLLVSRDNGATWTESPLPASTNGYALTLYEFENKLVLGGRLPSDRNLEFGRRWLSVDGESWEEEAETTARRGTEVPIDGFIGEGLTVDASAHSISRFDDVILAVGFVGFDLPAEVQETIDAVGSFDESWSTVGDSETRIVGYEESSGVKYHLEAERVGGTIDVTLWGGSPTGDVPIHTGRITTPSDDDAMAVMANLPFPTTVRAVWRSDDGGETFTLVEDPFRDLIGDIRGWFGVESLLIRGGRFVAYGRVPGEEVTGRDDSIDSGEPGGVGAIATSDDGITWDVRLVEGFDPRDVVPYRQGALWNGATSIWVSEDGVSGEVFALAGDNWGAMAVGDAFVIRLTSTALAISLDGRAWDTVGYPQRSAEGSMDVYAIGNAVIYRNWDGTAPLWIGRLET